MKAQLEGQGHGLANFFGDSFSKGIMVLLSGADSNYHANLLADARKAAKKPVGGACPDKKQGKRGVYVDGHGERAAGEIRQFHKYLTDKEVAGIIAEYNSGMTAKEIAEKYGCNKCTVRAHLKKNGVRMRRRADYYRA